MTRAATATVAAARGIVGSSEQRTGRGRNHSTTPETSYCSETEAPVSSAPAPTSGPTDSGSSCSSGQAMICATTRTGFQQCVNGSWITTQDCAPGTKYQSDGSGAAYCG
ncbi:hypothetical protein LPJ77_000218 [Coemansia sp. RSA 2523]|nr:hypothetical protein LPJ54_001035 [Coemansia sp. RSA 1824]KAJ1811354.1 hypothetical protein LPJ77_000218 [Coemansia sp. RSA 2523]KAJ2155702.1 hypothetical protein J3F82_000185 [Coemansia sp. RSA 637]KAJ2185130.1 hypothetical protein EV181_004018 [Coemansia sp. RSA 532]KAJ2229349.1 hypothetical protein GGH97_006303 [Coemansia sp. RSA 475]KAJ2438827.1 hypothetical protein IWW46_004714 [Coemansia sp. RSA 2440]KAJ2553301.1 hypothetical protein IWW35_001897 [Coemansia sp. RSA 1878]